MNANLLLSFQSYLEEKTSSAPASIKGYVADIRMFLDWAKINRKLDLTISQVKAQPHLLNKSVFEAYLKELEAQKKALTTIARHTSSIKVFSHFLYEEKLATFDVAEKIKIRKPPETKPRGLTDDERAKLEYVFRTAWERKENKTIRKRKPELASKLLARNKAIVFTLLYAGPRIGELMNVNVSDVTISERSGQILLRHTKNGEPRNLNIPKQVRDAISNWLEARKTLPDKDDALFIEIKKGFGRLSERSVQMMLNEASRRSGVQATPHVLRHTFAYLLQRKNIHPKVGADMMGHSLEMHLRYGSSNEEEKQNAADALDGEETI